MQERGDLDSTILSIRGQLKGCVARWAGHYCPPQNCGCSSVGRARLAVSPETGAFLVLYYSYIIFSYLKKCASVSDSVSEPPMIWPPSVVSERKSTVQYHHADDIASLQLSLAR